MTTSNNGFTNIFTGNKVKAHYTESQHPLYKHHPLIEALTRDLIPTESGNLMRRLPAYNEMERLKDPLYRLQAVQTLVNYIEPMPEFIEMEQKFSRMIRNGYMKRNPLSSEWVKQLRSGFPELDFGENIPGYSPIIRSNASGFAIIGPSGIGKSTLVESVLPINPQIIYHTEYNGQVFNRTQVVWLKLDCPDDGSIKGLCLNFLQALDQLFHERFYQRHARRTLNELVPIICQLAADIELGVFVIDEIQRLNEAKSGGAAVMLNFFTRLTSCIGVPVVLVGTFKALNFLACDFANARRLSSQGDCLWFNRANDRVWDYFLKRLWRYQWTDVITPLTPELSKAIYDESMGITDIAVKLYMLVQWAIIGTGDEVITPEIIRRVASESLKLPQTLLDALRRKDINKLKQIQDLYPPIPIANYLKQAQEKITIEGALDTIGKRQMVSDSSEKVDEEAPVYQIGNWLVEAGVNPKKAFECATDALKRFEAEMDLKKAKQAAFEMAFGFNTIKTETTESPLKSKKPKRSNIIMLSGDLRAVFQKGKSEGKTGFQSLKEAGYIGSVREFM